MRGPNREAIEYEIWRKPAPQSKKRGPTNRTRITDPQGIDFGVLARLVFPIKTTAALGHLTGCSRSTIHTWLSGEHEPPAYVLAIVVGELMRKLSSR